MSRRVSVSRGPQRQQPDLHARLAELGGLLAGTRRKTWPASARSLSAALRRLAPNLREVGIDIEFVRAAGLGHDGPLRDALPEELALALGDGQHRSPASFKAKLGKALAKRAGTRYGHSGLRIERAGQHWRSTTYSWRTLTDASQGSQGSPFLGRRRPGHRRQGPNIQYASPGPRGGPVSRGAVRGFDCHRTKGSSS